MSYEAMLFMNAYIKSGNTDNWSKAGVKRFNKIMDFLNKVKSKV